MSRTFFNPLSYVMPGNSPTSIFNLESFTGGINKVQSPLYVDSTKQNYANLVFTLAAPLPTDLNITFSGNTFNSDYFTENVLIVAGATSIELINPVNQIFTLIADSNVQMSIGTSITSTPYILCNYKNFIINVLSPNAIPSNTTDWNAYGRILQSNYGDSMVPSDMVYPEDFVLWGRPLNSLTPLALSGTGGATYPYVVDYPLGDIRFTSEGADEIKFELGMNYFI